MQVKYHQEKYTLGGECATDMVSRDAVPYRKGQHMCETYVVILLHLRLKPQE